MVCFDDIYRGSFYESIFHKALKDGILFFYLFFINILFILF